MRWVRIITQHRLLAPACLESVCWDANNEEDKYLIFRWWLLLGLMWSGATTAADSIQGQVINNHGAAEAGVWVIAETDALPTDYRKIVVTDDDGRFVLPSMPDAEFSVWVRGYGLEDSVRTDAQPGVEMILTVDVASAAADAALVYPANYWLALLEPPPQAEFDDDETYRNQAAWLGQFKLNCILCHQVGAAATRLPNQEAFDHGLLKAAGMNYFADQLGRERLLIMLDNWGSRIAAGAVPPSPPRPTGIERNIVITQWGWGDIYTYAHDEIVTDKRNPSVNAGGPVYGVDLGNDYLLRVDPKTHHADRIKVPTRDAFATPWCEQTFKPLDSDKVSPFGFGTLGCPWPGGDTAHADKYNNPANPHNPMMDSRGRIWMTTQIRRQWAEDLPEFCRADPNVATTLHHRQLGYYDPATAKFELIDTCFGSHHLQFDNNDVLWISGDDHFIGWLDTRRYDPTNPNSLSEAMGYAEVRFDTDGDGTADTATPGFHYGIIPNPVDGSVWSAVPPGLGIPSGGPGRLNRFNPALGQFEAYSPPAPGMGPRGVDVDTAGVIWTALAGSGHLARFDRRRCAQHWGSGTQCPEGWTLWATPGPQFAPLAGIANSGSTDMHYYLWVDQFDTLGLGTDVVIVNGTGSDSLIAFDPKTEQFTVLRIPYPLNTYTRGLDGRIDDPSAGWKGRGLWFTNGNDPVIHSEIPRSYVGQIQLRPHPLAE